MAFSCLAGFFLVGDTLYIRRLFQEGEEKRNLAKETAPKEITRQTTTKSFNRIVNTTFPQTEIPPSVFLQFPSRKQLLSRVAKAIHASKETARKRLGGQIGVRRNNSDIWSSFWQNEKSGKLKSEPRELALYDEEINWKGGKNSRNTNVIAKQSETGGEIKWRLSHLNP